MMALPSKLLIATLIAFIGLCTAANATEEFKKLRVVILNADQGNWTKVNNVRVNLKRPEARDLADWLWLRGEQGSFEECIKFLQLNSDWPGLKLLRKRCEKSILRGEIPQKVINYFAQQKPQTGTGSLRYAEALINSERGFEAAKEIRRTWKSFDLTEDEHKAYISRNSLTIEGLNSVRLDSMLWQGFTESASRMLPLVNHDMRVLARARIALRENKSKVNALINLVPNILKDDPGLAYERFLWRLRNGYWDGAIEILIDRSKSEKGLGNPKAWADWRRVLAREMIRSGRFDKGYNLATSHHLKKGHDYADLEWLAGFVALKKLTQPSKALIHFKRFSSNVFTPVSLGRAGYWLGLTYKELGDYENSQIHFKDSSKYLSSFYGQLSVGFLQNPDLIDMTGKEPFANWQNGRFANSSVLKAAIQASGAGSRYLTERLLVHLSEKSTKSEFSELANFANELGETHVSLMITKQAAREGFQIFRTYFPIELPTDIKFSDSLKKILPLSVIRRESEFDPEVISPVGARGLMQLMPKTAKEMADKTGIVYSKDRLLSDPTYNVKLGIAYLDELSDRFDGNIILVSAAYNAGPTRLDKWIAMFGDPRNKNIDIIDWIEDIPYRETRNYVMRVAESLLPYEARLNGKLVWKDLYDTIKK